MSQNYPYRYRPDWMDWPEAQALPSEIVTQLHALQSYAWSRREYSAKKTEMYQALPPEAKEIADQVGFAPWSKSNV